jgi:ABC-2 type transport system ATP-binding protein
VPASQTSVATLTNVTHRYGSIEALSDVTFELDAGQVTALLGPNGAGKTTIVRLLAGLVRPTRGRAVLFGGDPQNVESRRRLGVMLQVARVPETLTVSEHITLFSSYYPSPLPLPTVLRLTGLESVADRRYGKLSGGQQQRTLFALAVCGNPGLLFLDEPTVGMDVESRRQFWSTIRELAASGRSILLTTHYLEEADALATRIVVLNRGRVIADGTPATIKQQAAGRQIRCRTRLSEAVLALLRRTPIARCGRCSRPTSPLRTSRFAAPDLKKRSSRSPQLIRRRPWPEGAHHCRPPRSRPPRCRPRPLTPGTSGSRASTCSRPSTSS